MLNRLLFKLTANRPTRLIEVNDKPYLERYYLGQAFGVTFYLHRFLSADRERHLHNHPWGRGGSLVLSGGYDEEVITDLWFRGELTETRRIEWFNRVDGNHFHRIANAAPGTWTLFFHGERSRIHVGQTSFLKGWGFLENGTFHAVRTCSGEWWHKAPKGRDSARAPL